MAAAAPTEKYVYASYIDEPVIKHGTGGAAFFHQNSLWSVTALTNAAGSPIERYAYDAYGELSILDPTGLPLSEQVSAVANLLTYTGRTHDRQTGLYYYRARFNDSVLGRFISRDPLHSSVRGNAYEALTSNPTRRVDPTGNIAVSPGHMESKVTCGDEDDNRGLIWSQYKFTLDNGAPCNGWFFQEVKVYSRAKGCPCTYHGIKPQLKLHFWEWFGAGLPGIGGTGGVGVGQTGNNEFFEDEKKVSGINDTCGISVQENEVRFYCDKDLKDKTTTVSQGTFPTLFGGPVKGSGTRPATNIRPDFWDKVKPVESVKWRWQANWECCCPPPPPFASYRATQDGVFIDNGIFPPVSAGGKR
jgi:RHS repeat-associated protein